MLKRYSNLISGSLVLLFAAALLIATFNIKHIVGMTIGATFFPRITAAGLAILGLMIFLKGIRELRLPTADGDKERAGLGQGAVCTIQTLVLFFLYALVMEPIGFLLSTAIYLFAEMLVLSTKEERHYLLFAIISVVASAAIYFAFTKLFYLMLPTGILG